MGEAERMLEELNKSGDDIVRRALILYYAKLKDEEQKTRPLAERTADSIYMTAEWAKEALSRYDSQIHVDRRNVKKDDIQAAIDDLKSIEYYEKECFEDTSNSGFMLEESAEFIEKHYKTIQAALEAQKDDGWNYDMRKAPKDGTRLLLQDQYFKGENVYIGQNYSGLDYGSQDEWRGESVIGDIELNPNAWQYLPPTIEGGCQEEENELTEYMCPNCVTPWKCNGPHLPPTSGSVYD